MPKHEQQMQKKFSNQPEVTSREKREELNVDVYKLYGDPAYLQSRLLLGGFQHAWPGQLRHGGTL